jgi:putative peptide zinc metalloprotease protein
MSEKKNPKLRTDLKISRQHQNGVVHYVIKDPMMQDYYRFPEEEYKVISLFNGNLTLEQIVQQFNKSNPDTEIDIETVNQFYDTLTTSRLLEKPLAEQNLFLLEKMREQRKSALSSAKGSLMYFRISLFDPDILLNRLYPYIKWIFTPAFYFFSLCLFAVATFIIFQELDRLGSAMSSIITFAGQNPLSFLILWITVICIILFHELGHAFTCKHFGGEVHEIGILVMFFMPCFYANVNDAWTFEKRYQKLAVTFAGGLVEFFIGSVAAIFWFILNPSHVMSAICYQTMAVCAVSAVLCNFNPLMKLDGYYAFCDWVGIPNLKAESASFIKFLSQKFIFQMNPENTFNSYTHREKNILAIYGFASFFYMIGVMSGLFFMIRKLFIDWFAVLGVLLSFWVGWILFKGYIMKLLGFGNKFASEKISFYRSHPLIITTSAIIFVLITLYLISLQPLTIIKKCALKPVETYKIYANESGFLLEQSIHSGHYVKKGDQIGILTDHETAEEYELLKKDIQLKEINLMKTMYNSNAGENQKISFSLDQLKNNLDIIESKFARSKIISPATGIILSTETVKGYQPYFNKGSELCVVASLDSYYVEVNLLESEIGEVSKGDKASIRLSAYPTRPLKAEIVSISPSSNKYTEKGDNKKTENEFIVKLGIGSHNSPVKLHPLMNGNVKIFAGKMRGILLIKKIVRNALREDLMY